MQTVLTGNSAMAELIRLLEQTDTAWILAIDGDAAAGKTTLAKALSAHFDAPVIHMDDFFLPLELRAEERLSEPGGNVHYERFAAEVLPLLKAHRALSYRPFDCRIMDYASPVQIPASHRLIVEGAYSLHPNYGSYFDCSVFCTVSSEDQQRRILKRNGEAMAKRFLDVWIPMEKRYQEAFALPQRCDILYCT